MCRCPQVATLFVSRDKGVVLQDSFPLERSHTALVGMSVPAQGSAPDFV